VSVACFWSVSVFWDVYGVMLSCGKHDCWLLSEPVLLVLLNRRQTTWRTVTCSQTAKELLVERVFSWVYDLRNWYWILKRYKSVNLDKMCQQFLGLNAACGPGCGRSWIIHCRRDPFSGSIA